MLRGGGRSRPYRRLAASLDGRISYRTSIVSVDADAHIITTADRRTIEYTHLLWTGPLDLLVGSLVSPPTDVASAAEELVHNSVTIVGIGYEAPTTDRRSWLYFPDPDVPFYRATNFAKYSAHNVPDGNTDRYCSWMTEIASSPWRPSDRDPGSVANLTKRVDHAIREAGLVADDAPIASVHVEHLPYGYPVPTLGRDRALSAIQPWLMARGVLARGRFGAWRYELGNMDHAVKMGTDAARLMANGEPEQAWTL